MISSDFNMKIRLYAWMMLFLLLCIPMVGCSTAVVHKSLKDDYKNETYQIRVLSKIPTDEIFIPVKELQPVTTGGNLVGLIISLGAVAVTQGVNEANKSTARERVGPLRDASADFNFREQYWNTLKETLDAASWLKVQQLDRSSLGYTKEEFSDTKPPFLILQTIYHLSHNSQALVVQTKANLYIGDLNKPDYFGFYTYFSGKVGANDEKDDEAIKLWAENSAAIYRATVTEGIEQNITMLKIDLLDRGGNIEKTDAEEIELRVLSPISGETQTFKGQVISRTDKRVLIREKGGNLFSIATGL